MHSEFEKFKDLSKREVERLKHQNNEIDDALSSVKMEINSERPATGTLDMQNTNLTMTSNFSMGSVDVEELRQQLAQASIDLEE